MPYDLPGVALVTGAGSGIGRATAILYAKEGCTKLSISDRNGKSIEETKQIIERESCGVAVWATVCDVSDEAAVQAFIDGTVERFGRIDYAANVAGITRLGPGTAELSNAVWDEDYAINLRGLFLCERAELQVMLRQEPLLSKDSKYPIRGAIANIGSIASIVGEKSLPAYTASKHGVNGLTKADGHFYGHKGIRVNSVCPGAVFTDILANSGNDPNRAPVKDGSNAQNALRRFGDADEIAQCVVWINSGRASYVTATVLTAAGGEIGV
ncbi:hypothetical protein BDW75DRAFT_243394 [Aspergillus navahoensis]